MDKAKQAEFADRVVERKLATQAQVDECLAIVEKATEIGAATNLADTMVSRGYLSRKDADALTAELSKAKTTTTLGGYELLGTLGKGGMGVVYKARQTSMDRIVAMKVLRPKLSNDSKYVERFLREARSAARLSHSNIVHAIDAGQVQGHYYFVMEFVNGPTVAQRMKQQPFTERETLLVARDIAKALFHAHQHGIIHRDIKPENIMLTKDGTAKLADLGLARTTGFDESVTIEGNSIGTPHYMSPEQARGASNLDVRSDIYSLGATLFHMLTDILPFDGDTPAIVISKRLSEPVPSVMTKKAGITMQTNRLVRRMMAKDPADRYQTPQELLDDIEAILRGEQVVEQASYVPVAEPVAESKSPVLMIAVAVIAAGLFIGIYLHLQKRAPQPVPRVQESPAKAAYEELARFISANPGQLDDAIAQLEAFLVRYEGTPEARKAADQLAQLKNQAGDVKFVQELESALDRLMSNDGFRQSFALLERVRQERPDLPAIHFDRLTRNLINKSNERANALLAEADEAIAQGDIQAAREKTQLVAGFGIVRLQDAVRQRQVQITAAENVQRQRELWEEIKAEVDKFLRDGNPAAAARALERARSFPESFNEERQALSARIHEEQVKIEERDAAQADARLNYERLFAEQVQPLMADRKYEEAVTLLDQFVLDEKLRLAASSMEVARRDIERLMAFRTEAEARITALPAGRTIAIGERTVPFVRYDAGRIITRSGTAEIGFSIDRVNAMDLVRLAGDIHTEGYERAIQTAAFLIFDKTGDRGEARKILTSLERNDDVIRYIRMAGHQFEALEKEAETAFVQLERTAERNRDALPKAIDDFRRAFMKTRFLNEKLFEIERLRAGEAEDDGFAGLTLPGIDNIERVLIGYWPMDGQRDRTVPDVSGRGNHGRLSSGTSFRPGLKGGSVDVSGGPVEVPYRQSMGFRGSFSLEFCMYANSFRSPASVRYFYSPVAVCLGPTRYGYSSAPGGFTLRVSSGSLYLDLGDGSYSSYFGSVLMNQWYHIVVVIDTDRSNATVYINGRSSSSRQTGFSADNARYQHLLYLGGRLRNRFDGNLDEVRLWNIALNQTQVETLANFVGLGPNVSQADQQRTRQEAIRKHQSRLNERVRCDYIGYPLPYAIVSVLNQVEVPFQWEASVLATGDLAEEDVNLEGEQTAGEMLQRLLRPMRLQHEVTESGVTIKPVRGFQPPGTQPLEEPAGIEQVQQKLQERITLARPYPVFSDDCVPERIMLQYAVQEICRMVGIEFDSAESEKNIGSVMRRTYSITGRNRQAIDMLNDFTRLSQTDWKVEDGKMVLFMR